jgi:putative ABC transport system permease protein
MAAWSNKGWPANLSGSGEPERLQGFQVSANLFRVLGVEPQIGRAFVDEEDRPGANQVVVISHELWQRRFGGDRELIGRSINLNGAAYSVIGVMPADFRYLTKTDLWTPLAFSAREADDANANYLEVLARRRAGISTAQARTEVENLSRRQINNPKSDVRASVIPLQTTLTQEVRPMLLILFGAVGFVLLIACANVANLLLARASVRRRELAIRAALGAGRMRVVRQLLIESATLAVAGGLLGLLLAQWCIRFLVGGLPEYLANANSHIANLSLDTMTLGFTFTLSFLTTVIFGLVPALQISKLNLNLALKEGGRSDTSGRQQNRLRSLFVVAEIALAMVLLVGAGLMIKSFWRLNRTNPGFEPAGVLTAQIDPSEARYPDLDHYVAFYQQLIERVDALPGVSKTGLINSLDSSWPFSIDEHPPVADEQRPLAASNQVSPDYFAAMGIPLRSGRIFNDRDTKSAPPVILIDDALAHRYFPGENPVGKHLRLENISREIVGVVGETRFGDISAEPFPHMFLSYQQENWRSMSIVVRTGSANPMSLIPVIRRELAAIDKEQPIHSFKPLEQSVADWVAPQRFSTVLLAYFAALAAVLAAIGIYGVVSYTVTQRTQEIGVRIALGAKTSAVLKLVIGKGMKLALAGVVIGLFAAFALMRLMKSLLYGVSTADPITFVTISLFLTAVALVACYIPARRASRVDPMEALRYE